MKRFFTGAIVGAMIIVAVLQIRGYVVEPPLFATPLVPIVVPDFVSLTVSRTYAPTSVSPEYAKTLAAIGGIELLEKEEWTFHNHSDQVVRIEIPPQRIYVETCGRTGLGWGSCSTTTDLPKGITESELEVSAKSSRAISWEETATYVSPQPYRVGYVLAAMINDQPRVMSAIFWPTKK